MSSYSNVKGGNPWCIVVGVAANHLSAYVEGDDGMILKFFRNRSEARVPALKSTPGSSTHPGRPKFP